MMGKLKLLLVAFGVILFGIFSLGSVCWAATYGMKGSFFIMLFWLCVLVFTKSTFWQLPSGEK